MDAGAFGNACGFGIAHLAFIFAVLSFVCMATYALGYYHTSNPDDAHDAQPPVGGGG